MLNDIKTLTSVLEFQDIFFLDGSPITLPNVHHISSISCLPLLKMAHIFHIINRDVFFQTGHFFSYTDNDPYLFDVNKLECFDIDTEEEFLSCEKLYRTLI